MHPLLYRIKRYYRKEKLPDPLAYLHKWFGITPAGVLQIGANSGQEIKRFVMEGIQYGVFVEPLHKPFQQLASAVAPHQNYLAINALCAAESGREKTFYISSHGGISSSMLKPTGHLDVHPEIAFENEIAFQTTTVDEIIGNMRKEGRNRLVDNLDTLYIDVQGAEIDVLKGASGYLRMAKFIFAEVSHGGLYEGGTSLRPLIDFLEEHRFKLAFAYFNKHGWGDALFIKDVYFGQK